MSWLPLELERDNTVLDCDVEYEIHGSYHPAVRDTWPEEYPELEYTVKHHGKNIALTERETELLEARIWRNVENNN